MYTILISVFVGLVLGFGLGVFGNVHWGWGIMWGLLAAIASQVGFSLLLKRRVQAAMNKVQAILQTGQDRVQKKALQMQSRPIGSVKEAQRILEKEQHVFIEQALAATAALESYFRWMPLLDRQVATMRMQLYFQLKDDAAVDKLLPKCLYFDPMTAAMRMTRMYRMDAPSAEIAKFYNKQTRKLRYGQGAVLYGLMAWIHVQRNETEEARKVLMKANERMSNDTMKANLDHLTNGRVRQFSNSGLGDEWYALGLEMVKVRPQRQRMSGHGGRPF